MDNAMLHRSLFCLCMVSVFVLSMLSFLWAGGSDVLLVDDFNQQKKTNILGGEMITWKSDPSDASQSCDISFDPNNFGTSSGYSLRIDYTLKIDYNIQSNKMTYQSAKVTNSQAERISSQEVGFHSEAFNGLYIPLQNADVSAYKYLVFSAKGDPRLGFTRRFKLELQGQGRAFSISFDKLESRWKQFFIPLDLFSPVIDMRQLGAMVIVFDPENVTRNQGTIYLDDIYFAKSKGASLYQEAPPFAEAPKRKQPVKIDAHLDDWAGVKSFALKKEKNLEFGAIDNDRDLSARCFFQWDDYHLFFMIQVKDNEVVCNQTGKDIYKSDVVELFIDPQNDGLTWGNPADFQLGFAPTGPDHKPQVWAWFQNKEPSTEEVFYAAEVTDKGYQIEAAISWKFLGIQPSPGLKLGVSPAVHDLDLEDNSLTAKLNWYFKKIATDRYRLGTLELGQ